MTSRGISATVVRDTVSAGGRVAEDTYDWYAQDKDGNVWYLGEDTTAYEEDGTTSKEGSWEYGVDGALPGIVMPANPTVGDSYRQEYYQGHAEDVAEVVKVGETKTIDIGEYTDVVVTEDWNPLDPEIIENKYFAPGVGLIFAEHTAGPAESEELVEFTGPRLQRLISAVIQPRFSRRRQHRTREQSYPGTNGGHDETHHQDRDRDDGARRRCGGRYCRLRRCRR